MPKSIKTLDIPSYLTKRLVNEGVLTVEGILSMRKKEILSMYAMGQKSFKSIEAALEKQGLRHGLDGERRNRGESEHEFYLRKVMSAEENVAILEMNLRKAQDELDNARLEFDQFADVVKDVKL